MHNDEVDPARFMMALNRARVRWLLIGRQALVHYGVPAQTMDYDVWIDAAPANLARFLRVAHAAGLDAPPGGADIEIRPLFSLQGGTLKIDVFKARRFTNLDGETIDFASAWAHRVVARAAGDPLEVPLPALADLRLLKRMRDSERDREDLRQIDALERQRAQSRRKR